MQSLHGTVVALKPSCRPGQTFEDVTGAAYDAIENHALVRS
jgi:hypothetical protein